jgi:2-keto-3-deoxy-L-rhamnonate aldolase RhmA
MISKNRVKEMLKSNELTVGAWVNFGTPDSAEILANMDLDWLVFDTEHGPWSIETVQQLIQATAATQTVPIVRVAWNDLVLIKRALDIGAYGIIIPWINTKKEAIKAVRATKYPPKGIRGAGPRRAALFGLKTREYLDAADDLILVIAQIETEEAINNLEDIISVEGIDAVFIGPHDLSWSLGLHGNQRHPENLRAIDRVLEIANKNNVPAGIYTLGPDLNKTMIDKGFKFVVLGSDMSFMINGLRDILKSIS